MQTQYQPDTAAALAACFQTANILIDIADLLGQANTQLRLLHMAAFAIGDGDQRDAIHSAVNEAFEILEYAKEKLEEVREGV